MSTTHLSAEPNEQAPAPHDTVASRPIAWVQAAPSAARMSLHDVLCGKAQSLRWHWQEPVIDPGATDRVWPVYPRDVERLQAHVAHMHRTDWLHQERVQFLSDHWGDRPDRYKSSVLDLLAQRAPLAGGFVPALDSLMQRVRSKLQTLRQRQSAATDATAPKSADHSSPESHD